jgi:hypothetical protein
LLESNVLQKLGASLSRRFGQATGGAKVAADLFVRPQQFFQGRLPRIGADWGQEPQNSELAETGSVQTKEQDPPNLKSAVPDPELEILRN